MRRRLYFVLPNLESARRTEAQLLLARINDTHMHFMAADEDKLADLPSANLLQKSDLSHSMLLGLVTGGFTGIVLGSLLYLLPQTTDMLGLGIVLAVAVLGALIGSWAAGMIGISAPNSRLKPFKTALQRGDILLMVDVPKPRVGEITELMHATHPEAIDHGIESEKPAFP